MATKVLRKALGASATHLGTAFELRSMDILNSQLQMSLIRVGGKNDGGVDLRGWWNLPSIHDRPTGNKGSRALRVIAQCKAEKGRVGPRVVRELEGVARRAMDDAASGSPGPEVFSEPQTGSLVSVLCSQSGYTPGAFLQANTSTVPMLLLHIERSKEALAALGGPLEEQATPNFSEANLVGAFWNDKLAGPDGLLGPYMEIRREFYDQGRPSLSGDQVPFGLALFWRGQRLELP